MSDLGTSLMHQYQHDRPAVHPSGYTATPPALPSRPHSLFTSAELSWIPPNPPHQPSTAYLASTSPAPFESSQQRPSYHPIFEVNHSRARAYDLDPGMPLVRPHPSRSNSDGSSLPRRGSSLETGYAFSDENNGGSGRSTPVPNRSGSDGYMYMYDASYQPLSPPESPFPSRPTSTSTVQPSYPGPSLAPQPHRGSILAVIASRTVSPAQSPTSPGMYGQPQSHCPSASSSSLSSTSTAATEPPRTYPLPTAEALQQRAGSIDNVSDADQVTWAQDVVRLVDRHLHPSGAPTDFTHPDSAPVSHHLPSALRSLLQTAIPVIVAVTTSQNTRAAALASYLRAKLQSSGLCSELLPKNQRQAFKDFEFAARGGEVRGWYRLGRDYEGVTDLGRARDCFERGVKRGDCECAYRMGMAHLLGQLRLPSSPSAALPLLRQASELTNIDCAQPSYVYGMLLAGELSIPLEIPSSLVLPSTSSPSDALFAQHLAARESIEKAAYLCYPPAQYKAGFIYEHAALGCAYDPLVSVNWYTYASKGGEMEADMALSKWFLCGAEGHFPKNEHLAKTFAEKAARRGHPNGCFALGYYYEIGVGGRKDFDQARRWYQKASNLGNSDAPSRLAALSAPVPTSITMAEHESRLYDTLVRKRTLAKIRSDRNSISRPVRRSQHFPPLPPQGAHAQGQGQNGYINQLGPTSQVYPGGGGGGGGGGGVGTAVGQPPMQSLMSLQAPAPAPMSPAPRPGEFMSPIPNPYGQFPTSTSFPRPPIPPHAFTAPAGTAASHSPSSSTQPQLNSQTLPRRSYQYAPNAYGGGQDVGARGGGARGAMPIPHSTSLTDLPVPSPMPMEMGMGMGEERRGSAPASYGTNEGDRRKGPQTFAEMGFASKPVGEEGCVVM